MNRRKAIQHVYERHEAFGGCKAEFENLQVRPAQYRPLWIVTGFCTRCQYEIFYEVPARPQ